MTLAYEWVTTDDALDALADPWRRLGDDEDPGAVFRSWEWQATWWRTLGRRRGRELRVLVGRDRDGDVRGIVPMYLERTRAASLVPHRRLRLLGDTTIGSDYLGLVASRPDRVALARPFARRLATDPMLRRADIVELLDLGEADEFAVALESALDGAGFVDIDVPRRYICPVADWGLDFDAYLATRPQKFGSQVRNRRRELSRKPGFRLEVAADTDGVLANLEELFKLHRRRWDEDGGSEAIPSPAVEEFHRRAARLLADRGAARVAVMWLEGAPVAAAYGLLHGRRLCYYQAGLDPEWRKRSAGTVVMVELMRNAAAAGAREGDLLRGDEPYKAIWATTARATVAIHARRASRTAWTAARARAAIERLRAGVRGVLPEPALLAFRRLRARLGGSPS